MKSALASRLQRDSMEAAGATAATSTFEPSVRVLVVDDSPAERLARSAALAPLGYTIVEAESGVAALRCVTAQDFAVILLDVCMPNMNGFETAALIRKRRQSEMTPIIFVTAFGSDEILDADRYAQGAVDFMLAPIKPEELRAKVSFFASIFKRAEVLASRAREVQASADQLRLLTDAAPIGIFQADDNNRYVYTNPRWSEITGIMSTDAAGKEVDIIVDADQRSTFMAELLGSVRSQAEVSQRFEIRSSDKPSRIILMTSVSLSDSGDFKGGWVGTVSDVTKEAGAEAAMLGARDAADEASRLKSHFLTNMSHEIRTPMNGVLGLTELLLETDLNERQLDYAEAMKSSGTSLLKIVNDILDFSKIESGKLKIESHRFALRATVKSVSQLLAGSAREKGLELVIDVENAVPGIVNGDSGRLRQVLTNLIGNAIKFTHHGEIVLDVSVAKVLSHDHVIRFDVSDTGDGIASDKLGTIFRPFVQVDATSARKYEGTGLGLAISAQLVGLMGGECGVSSRQGVGSTFWFTIPVRSVDRQRPDDASVFDERLAGIKVLVVDDSAKQRQVLTDDLNDWGMAVTGAISGKSALAALRKAVEDDSPFALALVDNSMAGMSGLEFIHAISDDSAIETRVVLMSGREEPNTLCNSICARNDVLLFKPIDREELLNSIRVVLDMQVESPSLIEVELSPPISPPESSGTMGRILLAEDNLINQKVAVGMLTGAGYQVDAVDDGEAAVRAVAGQTYDAVLMDCQMPGMSGYEATALIRAGEGSGRRVPIIALTAGARQEDREYCLAEGMDGYISKPASREALLAIVKSFLKKAPSPSAAEPPAFDRDPLAENTFDKVAFERLRVLEERLGIKCLTELIDHFTMDTECRLAQLYAAISDGEVRLVARIADTIKRSGDQVGGRRFASSCGRLERKALAGLLTDPSTDFEEVEADYQQLLYALTQEQAALDLHQPPGGARLTPAIGPVSIGNVQR